MRVFKFVAPGLVLTAGLLVNSSSSSAKPQYSKETKKGCTFCHTTAKGGKEDKDLTDAGKYYKQHHSLEGYTAK